MGTIKKKILLVEDEALIAISEKKQLENIGYIVHHVLKGEDAIQEVRNNHYDLILMDIDLGSGIDGTQTAQEILKQIDIPVVYLSSHTEPEIVEKTEQITSYGYVVKNSGITILDASIKMALKLFNEKIGRRKAENKLKNSEERFRSFFNYSPFGINVFDMEGKVVAVNSMARKYFGVSETDPLTGYRFFEDRSITDETKWKVKHGQVAIEERFIDFGIIKEDAMYTTIKAENDSVFIRLTYTAYGLDLNNPVGIIAIIQDFTERKHTEIELKEKANLLSMLMETSPVGITTVDKNGNITYANKRAEEILGLIKNEITSRSYDAPLWNHTELDGSPLPDEKMPFNIVKTTMRTAYNIQHGITWPDGTVVILAINASPMEDVHGNFNGMIATLEDVTEAKNNENITIQKLNEKEMMLKEIHHRIKNNISSIESLLSQQVNDTDNIDAKNILKISISRIQSMRIIYENQFMKITTNWSPASSMTVVSRR